jgi:hypothetical protein
MPADRRIIVQLQAEGYRDPDLQGEYVPGAITAIGAWATRRDVGAELKLERSGTRDETARDWRIRWDSRIANSPTSLLKVEDGGETFTITNMVEVTQQRGAPDLRRRFLAGINHIDDAKSKRKENPNRWHHQAWEYPEQPICQGPRSRV